MLVACSTSISSRPVVVVNLIVVRTASMFGDHVSRSNGAFPPKWKERLPLLVCLSVRAFVFGVFPISCIGKESP